MNLEVRKIRNFSKILFRKMNRYLGLILTLLFSIGIASGQDSASITLRPVLSAYTAEIGRAHVAETYLSPLKYSGLSYSLGYERMQAMKFDPERWVMELNLRVSASETFNPSHSSKIWDFALQTGWGMMRVWNRGHWRFYAGGSSDISAGAFYSQRNSNNPVAAKLAWTVGAMGAVAYNTSVFHVPVCLRYQARLPLTGAFFAPEYGELYYEIYLGNHRNLAHWAWPGNRFSLDNLLTADLRFGATVIRLGYRLDILSSKTSHIVTRDVSHTFVFGFVSEWISLSPKHKLDARLINALY